MTQARGVARVAGAGGRRRRRVVRLRARRPRIVSARLHPDARHPDVRQHHAVSDGRADLHAEGPRSSSRAAAAIPWCRPTTAPTASSAAKSSRSRLAPVSLTDAQLASRYRVHRDRQGRSSRTSRRRRRCGRTRRCRSPTSTSWPHPAAAASDVSAFIGNERAALRSPVHRLRALGRQRDSRGLTSTALESPPLAQGRLMSR